METANLVPEYIFLEISLLSKLCSIDAWIFVIQFKTEVAKKFNAQPEQLCLIFAGKIMKDRDTLRTHNVKDGLTVHLVVKTPRSATQDTTDSSTPRPAGDWAKTYWKFTETVTYLWLKLQQIICCVENKNDKTLDKSRTSDFD